VSVIAVGYAMNVRCVASARFLRWGFASLAVLCCNGPVCPSVNADTAVHMHGSPDGTAGHNVLLVYSHIISSGPCTDANITDDPSVLGEMWSLLWWRMISSSDSDSSTHCRCGIGIS